MAERLRSIAAIGFFVVALTAAFGVRAQEPRIVSLEPREPAPFAGMLLPDDVAIRWRQEIERLRFELDLAAQRAAALQAIHADEISARDAAAAERLRLRDELWTARAEELRAAAADARRERDAARRRAGPRWWQRPGLWFALGAGSAGALAVVLSR
jgi:hypothetical protein